MPSRPVAIVAFPGVQSLDVTGPLEVLAAADRVVRASARADPGYAVTIVAPAATAIQTSSGLTILPHADLRSAPPKLDTLIVAGGDGSRAAARDAALTGWIAATASTTRRVASVCTGSLILAGAGLLDGRRATTHWAAAGEMARAHPCVDVDPEPIFVRDGKYWTSAGVTAGMDLALALVEEDLDREVALTIARYLVLFLRRPGNQSQFSAALATREPQLEPLREARRFALEHPAADLSVEALAARVHMSTRHFARSFRRETGVTPARYVEQVRLESARRRLEDTGEPIAAIANACGFGTAETMRRAFLRTLGTGPAEYRRRFRSTSHAA